MSERICVECGAITTVESLPGCPFCGKSRLVETGLVPPSEHYYVTKDSGNRREFPTGSVRDVRDGKGRFDLLWFEFIRRMAGIMERGAKKYEDRNWEKGQPVMSSYDSAMRHLGQAGEGLEDEDHLAAVAVNAMFMAFTIEMTRRGELPEELDDRPIYGK